MEIIYLIFFFVTRGAAFTDQVPQASMEQCQENGAALQKLYREIKFKCIPGLAEGSGTPISTEELMNRYGFKNSSY